MVLYQSYRYSVSTVDEAKRTQRQFQGAPQKPKTLLSSYFCQGKFWSCGVNGSDFAIPCLVRLWVITHALSYIHNMGDIRLKRWQLRQYVFLSNKEMFVVSHGQCVVLRQMNVWWNILAPILQ